MSLVANFSPRAQGEKTTLIVFLTRRDIATGEETPLFQNGDEVRWTLSPPGSAEITRTSKSGLTVDRATGEVRLALSSSETGALPLGSVPYRIRIADADGDVLTYLRGVIPIEV